MSKGQLLCCNKKVNCGTVWYLRDIKNFTSRKLFIGQCSVCKDDVVVLFEKRISDNKIFINEFTGIEAVKTIYREKKRKVTTIPDIKSDNLYGWVYGINTIVKRKNGKLIRQYASDFSGNRNLRKEVCIND